MEDNMGTVGILNVGTGDTKLTFDKSNPAECIRAARIVADMIKRGYVLLIETTKDDGSKIFVRAKQFLEDTCEYVVADFDPLVAHVHDAKEIANGTIDEPPTAPGNGEGSAEKRPRLKKVHASSTRSIAVPRTAGG